ncbi:MAG: outer membrane beta-barrel protein [Ignavibacteria bacterium]|nr:outer membrane beta-barrel protein [Ignavibacteria bacterium]MBK6876513.1 outer membrane beta-barrel protein [Ignavibacteria bacterium]MBK9227745.1 outer membrane beta-barrel protein [Ignavibacteria bacterium]
MKRAFSVMLLTVFCLISGNSLFAGENNDPRLKLNDNSKVSPLSIKERDYLQAKTAENVRTGKYSLFYLDFQLGYGSTKPNYDVKSGSTANISSSSQGGFTGAAFLTVTLFDLLNLTTGLDFTKKNFGLTADSLLTAQDVSNSYLNVPILFNFGGQVSDKIGINLAAGPYFGFLMGDEDNLKELGLKNFDFGIDAMLTADYALNQFVSILLGTAMQFGGLNNLGSTLNVENVKTTNWRGFTGIRIGL